MVPRLQGDILQRQNAHQDALMIYHWEAPDSLRGHGPKCGPQVVARSAKDGWPADNFAHFDLTGTLIPRTERNADVPVGNHAGDFSLIVDHR